MTIYVEWRVVMGQTTTGGGVQDTVGVPDDATDFTSRVRSVEVDMSCAVGRVGGASARIVFDNSDGAFTPFGGGTYEDWDWLANPVWVQAKTGTNPASLTAQTPLFGGVVSDVEYQDDGFTSTVTVNCDDAFTLAARGVFLVDWDNFLLPYNFAEVVLYWLAGNAIQEPPLFGADSVFYGVGSVFGSSDYRQPLELEVFIGDNFGDALNGLMVSEHGVCFPWILYVDPRLAQCDIRYEGLVIARDWLYGGTSTYGEPDEYTFVEGTPTGTELPFRSPTVGFNVDTLTNSAACTIAGTGAVTQEAENTASIESYGPRSAEFSSLYYGYDEDALELAEDLVARYSSVDFGITGITLTGKMIQGKCADTALDQVSYLVQTPNNGLSDSTVFGGFDQPLRGPLFVPMFVEFTGAGGVDLSSRVTFFRASYRITPDDWELTLSDGRPAVSSFGFVLGRSNYGVLGTNKVA